MTYYGDGREQPIVLTGSKLDNIKAIDQFAVDAPLGGSVTCLLFTLLSFSFLSKRNVAGRGEIIIFFV